MKKIISSLFILFIFITSFSQTKDVKHRFNFGFEFTEKGIPKDWTNFGKSTYPVALDSTSVKSGKYAVSIEYKEGDTGFRAWAFTIPNNYEGKKITLTGYIKTEKVTDGYAGLFMRIDPGIAFDNMNKNGVKGTTDWTKYEITLDMNPDKTKQIVIGGLLVGKGKMWLDDFSVTIDGKDIAELKHFEYEILAAEKDKEFDNGSQITTIPIDQKQIDNLKTLGLIWGFLKYYHPEIAKGKFNWDYELFRILPKFNAAKNKNGRDKILIDWINSLGQFNEGKETKLKASDIKLEPDLSWINTIGLSDELSKLLLKIKNADRSNEHFYIGLYPGVKNPEFKNENQYTQFKYPDAGFRLLSLYRYWNMIQYFFPYKNLIDGDWKNVLQEFIPKLLEAKNETDYTLAMLELIAQIHDTHANIWGNNQALNNYYGHRYAAVELAFVEDKPIVTRFYDEKLGLESGLKIGDVITVINNRTIDQLLEEKLKFTPASNYPTQLRDIANKLLRTNDSIINMEFIRDGKSETKALKTYSTKEVNIYSKYLLKDTCFKLINKDIAYLNNGSLKKNYLPDIWKEIRNTKGLIIDMRNYPSDFLVFALSEYLMPKKIPFVRFSNGDIQTPGLFTNKISLSVGKDNQNFYNGKVVILINEISQSSSEYHTMAYRVHPYATVLGSTTAGADGNVSSINLPGGITTMISGIGVYYPDGKETQRIGIVPDIILKPTIKGIKEGRDELMEKAIEIINGN